MADAQATPKKIIEWIDEQVELEKYATCYDSLGDEALQMLGAIKKFIITHTDPNEIWRKYG